MEHEGHDMSNAGDATVPNAAGSTPSATGARGTRPVSLASDMQRMSVSGKEVGAGSQRQSQLVVSQYQEPEGGDVPVSTKVGRT